MDRVRQEHTRAMLNHRFGSFLVCSLLGAVPLACGEAPPFEPAGPDAAPDPSTDGPYPVGVRTLELVDVSRIDERTGEARRLVVEVWYPATEASRGRGHESYPVRDFLPQRILDALGDEDVGAIETNAERNAELRNDGERWPLVVFSHGNGGVRMQSTYLVTALASHGYIVAAPDHAGSTLRDINDPEDLSVAAVLGSYLVRPLDLSFVIDHFAGAESDNPFFEMVDLDAIGVVGHSLGSISALRSAGLDSRIRVAIAQTPASHLATWLDVERPLEELGIPLMIQAAGADRTLPEDVHARSLWTHTRAPHWYVSLPSAGHFTYSDMCTFDLDALKHADAIGFGDVLSDGCGAANMPAEAAFPLIRHYTIGLFNGTLRNSPASLALLEAPLETAGPVSLEADPGR